MTLPYPRLDDRSFSDLRDEALRVVDAACPEWADRGPGDPGVTLIEAFAFLTDAMLYRLNRVPEKLRIALLNLAGVTLRPPSAAAVTLVFSRTGADTGQPIPIPAGLGVTASDGGVEFVVTETVLLARGDVSVEARALQCTLVEGELLGIGTGAPGQAMSVKRSPVIGPSGDDLDFILGVEAAADELTGAPSRGLGDKAFRIWTEVEDFVELEAGATVYRLERASGLVQFAPQADRTLGLPSGGAAPAAGGEVRAWYRCGGGRSGNVAPDTLTTLKTPLAGVTVTNPARAAGGGDGETVEQAAARGPMSLTAMHGAVTARDFERIALSVGGVARARAYAAAQAWRHAEPGVVETLILPAIDETGLDLGAVTAPVVIDHRRTELLERVSDALAARRPLGVKTVVNWVRVRPVSVTGRVVVGRETDLGRVQTALKTRLNALFSPLRDHPFGRELRASDAYEALLAEPGVIYSDGLEFSIDETPDGDVVDVVRDPHQAACWYAVTTDAVFRTLDDGESWARIFRQPGQAPRFLRRHPERAGLVVMSADREGGAVLHLSRDAGESWSEVAAFNTDVSDAAWTIRDGSPLLLVVTQEGLRQIAPDGTSGPLPVVVDKAVDGKGFYAIAAKTSPSGVVSVAVSARGRAGIFLSAAGGVSGTFRMIGLQDKNVRVLAVQSTNARDYLWASAGAEAGQQGEGAFRLELRASGEDDPDGFKPMNLGWQGGTCEGLAFADNWVTAGSNRNGVMLMDSASANPAWQAARLDAGLPIRDSERLLHVVAAVAAGAQPGRDALVFAGGPKGLYRSLDGGHTFATASAVAFRDRIPLPPNWLYCAGEHTLDVVFDDVVGPRR